MVDGEKLSSSELNPREVGGYRGSSRRDQAAAYIQAIGKVEGKGVSAILSCTKSPLRLE